MANREFYNFILELVGKFRPGQRRWIVRIFIVSGISLISHRFWEPWLEAWLEKSLELNIAVADVPGWILISIGLFLYFFNHYVEKNENKLTVPPPNTTAEVPLQRPQQAEHFTGREKELEKLLKDLQPGKIITLCGTGGIGKSALAAEAVWHLAPGSDPPQRFPDGIIWHDFYATPQVESALEHVARSFGEEPEPTATSAAQRALASRKALLLLDGTEAADDLQRLLSVAGNCGVLVTSQKHSDAAAEWQDIDPLPTPQAMELLQSWCPSSTIDDDTGKRICERLGGLALAVRLAGRYMNETSESAADYLAWLQDSPLEALNHGKRRLKSVPLLLERSIARLSEPSRKALFVTGLLALAPFSSEVVASALDKAPAAVKRMLGELVRYALLIKQTNGEGYAVSHRLIHTYTSHNLSLSSEVTTRLASYYNRIAGKQEQKGQAGYARLDIDRAHIMSVLAVCEKQQLWRPLVDLVWAIENFLNMQGYRSDQLTALEKGQTASKKLNDKRTESAFLGNLGIAYYNLGQVEKAIEYYEQVLAISREIGDRQGEGSTLGNLGIAYRALGQVEKAIEYYEQALAISREIGHRQGEGTRLGNLGIAYRALGQVEKARECYEQSISIFEDIKSPHAETVKKWLAELEAESK